MTDHSLHCSYHPTYSINSYPVVYRFVSTHVYISVMIINLALFHRCRVFIAHGTDLHPSLPLLISLPEELLHDSLRPLSIHSQGFRRIAQVSTVHHVPQHLQKHIVTFHSMLYVQHCKHPATPWIQMCMMIICIESPLSPLIVQLQIQSSSSNIRKPSRLSSSFPNTSPPSPPFSISVTIMSPTLKVYHVQKAKKSVHNQ